MTFLWIALGAIALAGVVLTLVDVFRRDYPLWTSIGWIALILVLPYVGSVIYWVVRKPDAADVEHRRLAQEDVRRTAARRPL